jgi:hypothetical protein
MSLPVRTNLDLGLNQLLAALVEVVGALPAVTNGRVLYNTGDNKFYVGEGGAWRSFLITGTRLDQLAAPTAAVPFNLQKITGLADGTNPADAATWGQVQSLITGINWKDAVRAATTANIALTGAQTIDTVNVVAGDRVLVKNQAAGSENGIYVAAAGAWTRAADSDSDAEIRGAAVFVEEGSQQNQLWVLSTDNVVLGTTATTWAQIGGGSASYTGGNGLTLTGNDFAVNVDGSSLEINADVLRVKALGIVAAMIADGAVTLTGGAGQKVTGTLPIANGGTGQTTAAAALTALGGVRKFSVDITGNGALTQFTVNHALATTDVQVQVWEVTTNSWVIADIVRVDANNVRIDFAQAVPNAKVYRVVVMG